MKHLLLMRHGDAVRGTAEMSDHQRPLSELGREQAAEAGAWLMAQGELPERILCSTALRARQTLECLGLPQELVARTLFSDAFYLASPGEMLQALQSVPEPTTRLLFIGHNPGVRDFCLMFAPEGDLAALDAIALDYKTAALTGLEFDIPHWEDMPEGGGVLKFHHAPR